MKNERGISLIELLAVITILLILSSLLYSVLIGTNRNYHQISTKNQLQQEANLIIAAIKNYHHQNASYYLSYDDKSQTASIGINSPDNLLGNNIDKFEVQINDTNIQIGKSGYQVFSSNSIAINIELKSQNNIVDINTIIKRY